MKKFLLILLIAVAASAPVQIENEELNKFISGIGSLISDVVAKVKEGEWWEVILEVLKQFGVPYAKQYCADLTHSEILCNTIIDYLVSLI